MGAFRNALSRRGSPLREQVIVGSCPRCGGPRVVQPCSLAECGGWIAVCDCNDDAETSWPVGGRCAACRSLPSEARDPWDPLRQRHPRPPRGTRRQHDRARKRGA